MAILVQRNENQIMRSLSSFSIDDSPEQFEPNLSSMKEVSDTETLISADNFLTHSDSNQSMTSVISTDSGTSKNKGKISKLQAESKAILKKVRQEKDKLRKRALRANETEEKRAKRLEQGRIYQQERRAKQMPKVSEQRLNKQKLITGKDRNSETLLETAKRLIEQETRSKSNRLKETPEQTNERLKEQEARTRSNRDNESIIDTRIRLEDQEKRTRSNRENESLIETRTRLEEQEKKTRSNRENESLIETRTRLEEQEKRTRSNRENESPIETEFRVDQDALRHLEVRLNETENAYVSRLEKTRIRNQRSRANETPAQKALRQQKDRDRHRAVYRPTLETTEERDTRLGLNREKRYNDQFQLNSYLAASFDPDQPFDDDPEIVPVHYCGLFDQICRHCGALYNIHETNEDGTYTKCCKKGVINLPIIRDYHPVLVNYLTHLDNKWDTVQQHFYENIRQYNSKLAFAGVQTNFDPVNYDNAYRNKRGYIYKCHGNMYFNFPPLFNDPANMHPPQTAQYYMMDTDTAHLQRTKAWYNDNGLINDQILRKLEDMIHGSNIYYRFFNNNKEELIRQLQEEPEECQMWLTRATLNMTEDRAIARQTILNPNAVSGEIAAVFADVDGNPPPGIKIAIYPRNGHRQVISIRDPNVDPMCFPLLFPYGEAGYDERVQHTVDTTYSRTTLKQFYNHRLHFRHDNLNMYFKSGKLFQEYAVHAWIKIESNNLNFIKLNQGKLKITKYCGIMGHKETRYNPENVNIGHGKAYVNPSNVPVSL